MLWDRDFLNKYIENTEYSVGENISDNNSLRILDENERIVAIEDGVFSKMLYQYLESVSREAIDIYLENGNENIYSQEMIDNVCKPIMLYNVKFVKLEPSVLHFVYYCEVNSGFINTKVYKKLNEISEKTEQKDDLFKIDVYYGVEDIVLEGKKIKINKFPEVNIDTDDMGRNKLLLQCSWYAKVAKRQTDTEGAE